MQKNEEHQFSEKSAIPDRHQNFWQLASIQSAAFGFAGLAFAGDLANTYGDGTAILAIWVGNLILWIISLAIVAMAYGQRKNAIENLFDYIGRPGSLFGALILLFAFLFWFTLQIRSTTSEIKNIMDNYVPLKGNFDIRMGAALGIIISLLSLGGIKLIKWITVLAFPFLLLFIIYAISVNDYVPRFKETWRFSLPAIASTVALTLPGMVNLPTFFRHARSRADAFFALTLMLIFSSLILCAGIWLRNTKFNDIVTLNFLNKNFINLFFSMSFLIISLVCVNLVNIYFASATWETIIPKLGAKGNAIVGMAGTVVFTFIQAQKPMFFLEDVLDSFIGSLGMVLLIAYLVRRIVNHRQRDFEKIISGICWIVGCATAIYIQKKSSLEGIGFFSSIGASALAFLIFLFVEETIWSFRNCIKPNKKEI